MKYSKKLFNIFLIVISILFVCLATLVFSHEKQRRTELNKFIECQNDFDIINNYILNLCSDSNRVSFQIQYDDHKTSKLKMYIGDSMQGQEIELEEDCKNALDNIKQNLMPSDFSFIDVTTDRVSYGGLGNRMYVFLKEGKKPNYFYSPKDNKTIYTIYNLNNSWYLLDRI